MRTRVDARFEMQGRGEIENFDEIHRRITSRYGKCSAHFAHAFSKRERVPVRYLYTAHTAHIVT
jgi:hypothetical protein